MTQCRRCWRFDHPTDRCKDEICCRLCSGPHEEKDHESADPLKCNKCCPEREMGDIMDTAERKAGAHTNSNAQTTSWTMKKTTNTLPTPEDAQPDSKDMERPGTLSDEQPSPATHRRKSPQKNSIQEGEASYNGPMAQGLPNQGPSQNRYEPLMAHTDTPAPQTPIQPAQHGLELPTAQPWF